MRVRPAVCLASVLLLLGACDNVQFVDRVVLVNDTSYHANVDVRGTGGGWLGLTTVTSGSTTTVQQVVDQGNRWTFRFTYGVHDPVEATLTKKELIEKSWRVEVPAEFEQQLRDEGVVPPP